MGFKMRNVQEDELLHFNFKFIYLSLVVAAPTVLPFMIRYYSQMERVKGKLWDHLHLDRSIYHNEEKSPLFCAKRSKLHFPAHFRY